MKKILRTALLMLLSVTLLMLVTLSLTVVVCGFYVNSLETELDEALFEAAKGDKTTRLYYRENGELKELASDRISGYENALYCKLEEMP